MSKNEWKDLLLRRTRLVYFAHRQDLKIRLVLEEKKLLSALLQAKKTGITKDKLCRQASGRTAPDSDGFDIQLFRLRKKLELLNVEIGFRKPARYFLRILPLE
jgi:DNA-binding response OmpR family regulator